MRKKLYILIKKWIDSQNSIHAKANISKSADLKGTFISHRVSIGNQCMVKSSHLEGEIAVGGKTMIDRSHISGFVSIDRSCKVFRSEIGGNVTIGRHTSLWGPNLNIYSNAENPVVIGNFCSIARNVDIQSFNHNYKKATTYNIGKNFFVERWKNEKVSKGAIIINNDVWIGAQSVILPGVEIGNGAVIAAGSVVTKNIPAYAVAAGNPAKILSYRFDDETIGALQQLQWWNWPDEKIAQNRHFFESELTIDIIKKVSND